MAVFNYEAIAANGKISKGILEADTPKQVRQQLRGMGLNAISVTPVGSDDRPAAVSYKSDGVQTAHRRSLFEKKASSAEVTLMTRQLATLIAAGIPIDECLLVLSRQLKKAHLKSMIASIRSRVLEGNTLADSLSAFPSSFDQLYRSMVAAGEKSGHLDNVLERLADYTEHRQKMKGQLTQAMVYPVMLTLVAVGVVGALLATVVPTVTEQFAYMGKELPQMTQVLIALSDFVLVHGTTVVLVVMIAFVVRGQMLARSKHLRLQHDRLVLKLPIFGNLIRGVDSARFARTLSIVTSSTIPLLEGMSIASAVVSNQYMKVAMEAAANRVREGGSLWQSLEMSGLFSPMMLYIIASGEKSGELTAMLGRAADNQDQNFETQVSLALSILTPSMVVLMAGMVLFIVIAILTPMLNLNSMMSA